MNKLNYIFSLFLLSIMFMGKTTAQLFNGTDNEHILVFTDRTVFVAGENLFFTFILRNGSSIAPVKSRYAYLVLRNDHNSVIWGICLKLDKGRASGSIYLPDTLRTGTYQLVSYTNYMRNRGEKSFFHKEILVANRFDNELLLQNLQSPGNHDRNDSSAPKNHEITISSDKEIYAKRKKIRIALETPGIKEGSVNLSVSVHETVPGYRYPSNLLPVTNGSAEDPGKNKCKYFPESEGIILQGKLLVSETNQPVPHTTVFLSSPDTIVNLQYTTSDDSGIFHFLLKDYYDNRSLFVRAPYVEKAYIELENKFDLQMPFQPEGVVSDSSIKVYILKDQRIVQIQKTYPAEQKKELARVKSGPLLPPLVYPPLDNPVYPADFVPLPDFIEISREILPFLKTRKNKTTYIASVLNEKGTLFFDSPPAIFLDGVPIDDINQIIKLTSNDIYKIETIPDERYFGDLYFQGILAVFSKKSKINDIAWIHPTLMVKSLSFHPSSLFVSPDYSSENKSMKHTPDFRQLLYWNPDLTILSHDKKYIEFYASDNTGEFDIMVEGVTSEGKPVTAISHIRIVSNVKTAQQ